MKKEKNRESLTLSGGKARQEHPDQKHRSLEATVLIQIHQEDDIDDRVDKIEQVKTKVDRVDKSLHRIEPLKVPTLWNLRAVQISCGHCQQRMKVLHFRLLRAAFGPSGSPSDLMPVVVPKLLVVGSKVDVSKVAAYTLGGMGPRFVSFRALMATLHAAGLWSHENKTPSPRAHETWQKCCGIAFLAAIESCVVVCLFVWRCKFGFMTVCSHPKTSSLVLVRLCLCEIKHADCEPMMVKHLSAFVLLLLSFSSCGQ